MRDEYLVKGAIATLLHDDRDVGLQAQAVEDDNVRRPNGAERGEEKGRQRVE